MRIGTTGPSSYERRHSIHRQLRPGTMLISMIKVPFDRIMEVWSIRHDPTEPVRSKNSNWAANKVLRSDR